MHERGEERGEIAVMKKQEIGVLQRYEGNKCKHGSKGGYKKQHHPPNFFMCTRDMGMGNAAQHREYMWWK